MVAKLGNREDPLPQDSFEGVDEDEWVSELVGLASHPSLLTPAACATSLLHTFSTPTHSFLYLPRTSLPTKPPLASPAVVTS